MNKKEIIRVLETIAVLLEIKGENTFKTAAYRRAAAALEQIEKSMDEIEDPSALKGIGKGTAQVISDCVTNGHSPLLEELEATIPPGLPPLLSLPGLGGKKIAKLSQELGIRDAATLKAACEQQKVRQLPGFGEKSELKILEALEKNEDTNQRLSYASVRTFAQRLLHEVCQLEGVEKAELGGSFRRTEETVKDLDMIVATKHAAGVSERLKTMDSVEEVIAGGEKKVTIRADHPSIQVDFRLVSPDEFAATLHHFTGSKEHNVRMRQIAKERAEKISEYGIETEHGLVVPESEEALYARYNLPWMPPEIRQGHKEFDLVERIPELLKLSHVRGDLHMHTTWSDGAHSVEEMALAAKARGYEYIVITDHSVSLRVANGLTSDRLRRQSEEIDRVNEQIGGIHIFKGTEMDILPDGSLDYEDDLLQEMDFVIASIHSSFQQSSDKIMQRLENALKNAHVDLIAHPTGRLIGRRDGYKVDVDALIHLASETNTALELNANPNRFDLHHSWLEKVIAAGVPISISTDAHSIEMLSDMEEGVRIARKAFAKPEQVLNTKSKNAFKQWINRPNLK
ncbi:DNA polymerase/3'-5' exonuclease PolX [Bacillaceae bacterium SIJ1]|uniref:DNA polymerase/3'-5' exonuclease PolX n=1 Tax=Litoribacterium kuwaitense TaxID=1398745 RepID=UPI0013ED11CA|nr:DNA polymerase/3'-5' exonuclease PolX [Litoribacterium kuwaitense]NGP44996.1 DNA polymerase/3'-5' exonuclease PolX [Litoribacterium kuwaitense]